MKYFSCKKKSVWDEDRDTYITLTSRFIGANLTAANLHSSELQYTNFTKAVLKSAKLIDCKLKKVVLDEVQFEKANYFNASYDSDTYIKYRKIFDQGVREDTSLLGKSIKSLFNFFKDYY